MWRAQCTANLISQSTANLIWSIHSKSDLINKESTENTQFTANLIWSIHSKSDLIEMMCFGSSSAFPGSWKYGTMSQICYFENLTYLRILRTQWAHNILSTNNFIMTCSYDIAVHLGMYIWVRVCHYEVHLGKSMSLWNCWWTIYCVLISVGLSSLVFFIMTCS